MFQVGNLVRIFDVRKEKSRIGIISIVNDNSCDVIYNGKSEEEESNVSFERVIQLETFESLTGEGLEADLDSYTLKERGNMLFGKKDFNEAKKYYEAALKHLKGKCRIQIGANVLVESLTDFTDIKLGMISDFDNDDSPCQSASIIFDGVENEEIASRSQLIIISNKMEDWDLQRSLYLNLCRCCQKLSLFGWASKNASIAISVTRFIIQQCSDPTMSPHFDLNKVNKQLLDGYYLRASALLSANRPLLSKRDGALLAAHNDSRAPSLLVNVSTALKNRQRLNRRLAHQVAAWVDIAMSQQHQPPNQEIFIQESDSDFELYPPVQTTPLAANGTNESQVSIKPIEKCVPPATEVSKSTIESGMMPAKTITKENIFSVLLILAIIALVLGFSS